MSNNSCIDHAVDGFTVWGMPLIYRVGNSFKLDSTMIKKDTDETNVISWADLDGLYPWQATTGAAATTKVVNQN